MVWVLAGRDDLIGGITRELEGTLKEGGQASRDERIPFSWGVFTQYPALWKG